LPLPAGYYRITEWRDWNVTSRRALALSVEENFNSFPPAHGKRYVFSEWALSSYTSAGIHYRVSDLHGNSIDLRVYFPPNLSVCWKARASLNGSRMMPVTTVGYLSNDPTSCRFPVPEPPFSI
jgi:hypothetical protein